MNAENIRFIREEIKRQLNVLLPGSVLNSQATQADVANTFPGMSTIQGRPVIAPYGFSSLAPDNTVAMIGRVGEHFGNRVVLGHLPGDRPTDLSTGECAIYSQGGYSIRVHNGLIELGKDGVWEPCVMGETLRQVLISLVNYIVQHTHEGNLGFPTGVPSNVSDFEQLLDQNLENKFILAVDGGRF